MVGCYKIHCGRDGETETGNRIALDDAGHREETAQAQAVVDPILDAQVESERGRTPGDEIR